MSSSTPDTFRAAVLTVSDSCARGEEIEKVEGKEEKGKKEKERG